MNLQLAKWGNCLALRIPADLARQLSLRAGGIVEAHVTLDGALSIRPAKWNRQAFARELSEARDAMPMTESALAELRGEARY